MSKRMLMVLSAACALAALGMARAQGPAATETVVHTFKTGAPNGSFAYPGVIRDPAGNLYGTTVYGGTSGAGVLYKVDSSGKETVLYNFTGGADGGYPYATPIADSAGNLYGTTENGGTANPNGGVVYKVDVAGHETVLHSFTGGADGQIPSAGVIRDSAGNLYGTTQYGGTGGWGVVYKLDTSGTETVLYTFTGGADGAKPFAGVIGDSQGGLYGTTYSGGTGAGVVYRLDKTGKETVLYTFTGGADGGQPLTGVIGDAAGNLYGTTSHGGTANVGVVYELGPGGHETVLHSFTGGADGGSPNGVIRDSAGDLYGTAEDGGKSSGGVVYLIKPH